MKALASKWFATFTSWLTGAERAGISLSLLRILYGISMLGILIPSAIDRHYLWGIASTWVEPEAKRQGYPEIFRILFSKSDPFWFDVSYLILCMLAATFVLGWRTRWVTPVLLLFWVGLSTNSTVLNNGGDVVVRITLFFLMFANLSKHFSLDARRRTRMQTQAVVAEPRFAWRIRDEWKNAAHNTALMLCCYQIILIYVNSGILKALGSEWREGSALYYALSLDVFMPFPALSQFAWQLTPVVMILSWLSIWVQILFPVLLPWRYTRYAALAILMGMHFGIGLFLSLWSFSIAMIALDLLFIRDSSWRSAWAWFRKTCANALTRFATARRSRLRRPQAG